jgi:hypothetical protein
MNMRDVNLRTVGRWIVPATVVSLAVSAIVFLGAVELTAEDEGWAPPRPELAAAAPAQPQAPAKAQPRVDEPATPRRAQAPAKPLQRGQAAVTQPASWRRPQPVAARGESAAQAATLSVRLARCYDLGSRLRLLDRHFAKLPKERAVQELEGLLDGVLPGRFAEAEQLRLSVLARLGRYDDSRVELALVRRLETDLPRPQRLLALELLAARPNIGRTEMATIAASDHDLVVQKKAAWALRHAR